MDSGRNIADVAQRLDAAVVALGSGLSTASQDQAAFPNSGGEAQVDSDEGAEDLKARSIELEAINRDLENFIGTISHDLRSPLRSVVGTSQILIEDYGALLPDEALDLLRRQVDAGKRMSSLIDDLVHYTRLGQGLLERFEFDLTVMAKDVSYELSERSWSHSLDFKIEPGMRLEGYPSLVRVVLHALLENSVKFAAALRDASIEVGSMMGPRERIFFVRDNGPGFPQDAAGQIFEPFVRLCDAHVTGNGIGLANARKAVVRHGGRIWAEAQPGSGATFFFTLG